MDVGVLRERLGIIEQRRVRLPGHVAAGALGNVLVLKPKTWIAYYTSAKLPASIKEKGGSLCFKNMTGKGQIYVNGEMLFEKKATAAEDIVVPLKSGLEKIELNILMQPDPKGHLLLGDMVFVTQEKLKKSSSK